MVMDIIVADIPPKYGMLLSKSWMENLHGEMKTDISYITVLVFGGQKRRLYRESLMQYMINSKEKPTNNPKYAIHSDLDYFVLFNSNCFDEEENTIFLLEIKEE